MQEGGGEDVSNQVSGGCPRVKRCFHVDSLTSGLSSLSTAQSELVRKIP
jgi:hypothetical protein